MRLLPLTFAALCAAPALADVPSVATDIAPVHSLVDMVLGDLGEPALIVRAGSSPHGYALRPSEAEALQNAGLVVWVGHSLTPWLEDSLNTLAPDAPRLELLDVPGTTLLEQRDWGGEDDHGDEDGHDHGEGGNDPHAWLDPDNAEVWLTAIAEQLAEIDPSHAADYRANAKTAMGEIDLAAEAIKVATVMIGKAPVLVQHDAFQYLEARYGLTVLGAVAGADGKETGLAELTRLRDTAREAGARCVLTEPQYTAKRIYSVFGEGGMTVAEIDVLGAGLEPGAALYPELLRGIGKALEACY